MVRLDISFEAIGTQWHIDSPTELTLRLSSETKRAMHSRIEAFDKNYSRFRHDSWVMNISRKAGSYPLPVDGYQLIDFYHHLYEATEGAVTPLIGQVMADAGYDASYSFTPKQLTAPPRWDEVMSYTEQVLILHQPVVLDFGAAGKGYLVDIIGELLREHGIQAFTINAGGDIMHVREDKNGLTVGLENPFNASEIIGVAELGNESICASAGSRRRWDKYHHIINPNTLVSPREIAATWVIADSTMLADGIATALFFCEPDELYRQFQFTYARLGSDMSLEYSREFPFITIMENR